MLFGRAPLTIPWLSLGHFPNLTAVPYAPNRPTLLYRRDALPSIVALSGATFVTLAALSGGLGLLQAAVKAETRVGPWRPLLLELMMVIGGSLLESFLSTTFTAPIVPRPPIYDVASLFSSLLSIVGVPAQGSLMPRTPGSWLYQKRHLRRLGHSPC